MCPQRVQHRAGAEFGQVVRADHRVLVLRDDVVDSRLVLDEIVGTRQAGERPLHVTEESGLTVSRLRPGLQHVLERRQPALHVEAPAAQRALAPRPYFQLAGAHRLVHADGLVGQCFGQPPEMFVPPLRIDVMVGLVTVGETIPDEGEQHAVLLIEAVEERTDMPVPAKLTLAEPHLIRRGLHVSTSARIGGRRARRAGLGARSISPVQPGRMRPLTA